MSADLARLARGVLHLPAEAPAPVALAASELGRYLEHLFGVAPTVCAGDGPPGAWLCLAPAGEAPPLAAAAVPAGAEHLVRPAGDAVMLAGTTPRALLAAAYALLAGAGCRWSPAGAAGEVVPGPGAAARTVTETVARPPFARRVWAADLATWHYGVPARLADRLPGDLAFVDWMARTGATGFLFIRHANDDRWTIPALGAALAARGLAVEPGGHALAELLPRALAAGHPEWFPLAADGRRSDLGNVCVSSRAALARVTERARAALETLPGVTDFHCWGLDLWGGGWCRCAGCVALAPSDQALAVCNAVADAVAPVRVFHLAYHDTLAAPARVHPHPGVAAEFAPRERCYAHPLDDAGCAANGRYRDALARHLERFDGRVHVFEYYADAILFGGCPVPLGRVIASDLAAYARLGVRGVSCLTFGAYSLLAYGTNLEAFAGGAWGSVPVAGPAWVAALEDAMAGAVTAGDVLLPPRDDPAAEAALATALGRLPAVRRLLAASLAAHPGPRPTAEAALLDYTTDALTAVHGWLAAVRAGTPAAVAGPRAAAALRAAARRLETVPPAFLGTWGTHDLPLVHHLYAMGLQSAADPRSR